MKEFPESVIAAYVDGELSPEETRELELHLVQSREARQLVVALQAEATLLRDALQGRPRAAAVAAQAAAPGRGLAIGLPPALAVGALLVTVIGWIAETRIPSGFYLLNPFNWFGAYDMAFSAVFWLRREAPGLVELTLAVAVTVGVSAMLTFGVTALFRRLVGPGALGIALLVALGAPGSARAVDLRFHEDVVTIGASEVIPEALVVTGDSLYIEGVVDGDVAAFTERVVINGEVRGDVFALSQTLELAGVVTGSLHAITERLTATGEVRGDSVLLVEHASIGRSASIGRDLSGLVANLAVDGSVGRNLFAGADRTELRGRVDGRAELRGGRVSVFDSARIGGDLVARLGRGQTLDVAEGAVIGGEIIEAEHEHRLGDMRSRWLKPGFYGVLFALLVSAFLLGMAVYAVAPRVFAARLDTSPQFFRALGLGLAGLVAAPVLLALVFLTVVGIPIAVIGTWLYLTTLFLSLIVVSALVGRALIRREDDSTASFGICLVAGLAVVLLAVNLPWVGLPLRILVILAGLGLLTSQAIELWRERFSDGAAGWQVRG